MKNKVTITNKTGNPDDTEIVVDGKKLPLSHMMSVDISIHPDNGQVLANVELIVDDLDILGEVTRGV